MEKIDIDATLAKATPRPWNWIIDDTGGQFSGWPSIEAHPDLDTGIIHRAGFKQEYWGDVSRREACANAALIVAAVNTFEPMREALKIAVERLGHYAGEESRNALARIRELVPEMVTK